MVFHGDVYVSKPTNKDSNFKESIVLVADSDASGVIGFIVNKPLNLVVKELLVDFESDNPVFYGGPVQTDRMHYFHNFEGINSSVKIANGIYWGGDFEEVKLLVKLKVLNKTNFKFFVGYSGWTKDEAESDFGGTPALYRKLGKIDFDDFFLNNKDLVNNWSNSYLKVVGYHENSVNRRLEVVNELNKCKDFLSQNRLEESLNVIIEKQGFNNTDALSSGILLMSRLNEVKNKSLKGLISFQEENHVYNNIRNSIITLIFNEMKKY